MSLADGSQIQFGGFTVRSFRFSHSWPNLFAGEIAAPLKQPAPADAFRDRGSLAFLISRGNFRILVHPSAAFVRKTSDGPPYDGIEADVLFLSIGGILMKNRSFAQRYWDSIVSGRRAALVVPIHWDDFARPLAEGLRPARFPENGELAMRRIQEAGQEGPPVRLMPLFAPVDLERAAARPSAAGAQRPLGRPAGPPCGASG